MFQPSNMLPSIAAMSIFARPIMGAPMYIKNVRVSVPASPPRMTRPVFGLISIPPVFSHHSHVITHNLRKVQIGCNKTRPFLNLFSVRANPICER